MKTIAINKTLEIHKPVEFPRFGVESVKVPQIGEKVYMDSGVPTFLAAYLDEDGNWVRTEISIEQLVDKDYAIYIPKSKVKRFGLTTIILDGERITNNAVFQPITDDNKDEVAEMLGVANVGDFYSPTMGDSFEEFDSIKLELIYDGKTYNLTIK